jgi:hypothetical protein
MQDLNTVQTGGGILFTLRENALRYVNVKVGKMSCARWRAVLICFFTLSILASNVKAGKNLKNHTPELVLISTSNVTEGAEVKDSYDMAENKASLTSTNEMRELGYLTITNESDYANGTHVVWATYNLTAQRSESGRSLQVWSCYLTSRCEEIATGALSYARSCAGSTTTSNCVKWKRGNAIKVHAVTGVGNVVTFASWCQGVLSPASRILYGELDTGTAYYTGDTYSYGGRSAAYIWTLKVV